MTKKGQVFEYWKNSKEIFIIDWGMTAADGWHPITPFDQDPIG